MKKKKRTSTRDLIMKRLGCFVFVKPMKAWLFVNKFFNAVAGSEELGLPAGRVYHFAGKKHGGKTAIVAMLCGLLQKVFGAFIIWIDIEGSYDRRWMRRLGVNTHPDHFYLIYPKILKREKDLKKGKKTVKAGTAYLQSAESLFKEAEAVMVLMKERDPKRRFGAAIDSIANLQTAMVTDQDPEEANMRANLDRSQFLGRVLPRWIHLAKNYTMWVFLINQVRVNPSKLFGDNEYSPGGNALNHAAHVMVKIRRKEDKFDTESHSFSGYMLNAKNKAGGGSMESQQCNYRVNLKKKGDKVFVFSKKKG